MSGRKFPTAVRDKKQLNTLNSEEFPFSAPGVKKSRGNVLGVPRDRRGPLGGGFPKPRRLSNVEGAHVETINVPAVGEVQNINAEGTSVIRV